MSGVLGLFALMIRVNETATIAAAVDQNVSSSLRCGDSQMNNNRAHVMTITTTGHRPRTFRITGSSLTGVPR